MKREMEMARIQTQEIIPNSSPDREKLEDIAEILGIDYSNKGDNELRMAIDSEIKRPSK
jgi:sec-independent protein translocase protein TatA